MKFHRLFRTTLIYFISTTALLGGIGCALAAETKPCEAQSDSETPRFSQTVLIQNDTREQFFEAIRDFSTKNGFAYRIAPSNPRSDSFLIQLWREDIKLVAVNSFDSTEFKYYIYNTCSCGPVLPQPELLAITNKLRHAISNVKSAKFID